MMLSRQSEKIIFESKMTEFEIIIIINDQI
jgi:hypothetical protein